MRGTPTRGTPTPAMRRSAFSRGSAWLAASAATVASALRAIAGAPDYERYLGHLRAHHPCATPLSRDEFTRDRLAHRYNRPGSRCC